MPVKLIIFIIVAFISYSTGDDIAKRLKKRYNKEVDKCVDSHKKEKPAYECSGIMMRGVRSSLKFAWDMKSLNQQKEAFSLSFLRRDQMISRHPGGNYDSGFIVYPHLKTPRTKNTYKVFCSFPFDAWTDLREGHGCGKSKGNFPTSNHCDKQNIKSFSDWKSFFNKMKHALMRKQCAFDMTKKSAAKYFAISINAKKYIHEHIGQYSYKNNELRMHAWSVKKAKKIPIEAFFYTIGSARGKHLAEKYQDDFYKRGGGEVPIVGLRLPKPNKAFKVTHHKRRPRKHK